MIKRYNKNKINNVPFGGDIRTQGGVLIFDKQGELRYAYHENYGEELNLEGASCRGPGGSTTSRQEGSVFQDR
jgi:hypothetical protein